MRIFSLPIWNKVSNKQLGIYIFCEILWKDVTLSNGNSGAAYIQISQYGHTGPLWGVSCDLERHRAYVAFLM